MLFAKLHPLLVHFPVGLLVSGAVFEIFGKIWKDETAAAAGWLPDWMRSNGDSGGAVAVAAAASVLFLFMAVTTTIGRSPS